MKMQKIIINMGDEKIETDAPVLEHVKSTYNTKNGNIILNLYPKDEADLSDNNIIGTLTFIAKSSNMIFKELKPLTEGQREESLWLQDTFSTIYAQST